MAYLAFLFFMLLLMAVMYGLPFYFLWRAQKGGGPFKEFVSSTHFYALAFIAAITLYFGSVRFIREPPEPLPRVEVVPAKEWWHDVLDEPVSPEEARRISEEGLRLQREARGE